MGSHMILLLLFVPLLARGGTTAETNDDCTNAIMSMSPCLGYITGNSSSSSPSPSAGCCTQLSTVVRNSPRCLCQVLDGGGSTLGLNINETRALALPASCNVRTPSVNHCTHGGGSSSRATPSESGGTMTTSMEWTSRSAVLIAIIPLLASFYVSTFLG